MHFEFDLMVDLWFENEIIESATDESIGADVGIRHIVLVSELLLTSLHNFCLSLIS